MPWFNVDDGFAFHRKAVRAGNAAIGLWTRAGSWCAGELTDGFVPDHMIRAMRGTAIQTQRLVDAGLWVRDDVRGGFQFHEWSESGRNPTRKEVEKRREEAAKRKQKSRGNQHGKSENSQVGESGHGVTDAGVTGGVTGGRRAPTPLPSPPSSPNGEEQTPARGADDDFDRFWAVFPRRTGKGAARTAWAKARKLSDPERIILAAERFAGIRKDEDPRFTPHPATWLNQQRWDDEPEQPRLRVVGGHQAWTNPADQSAYDEEL